MNKIWLRRCLGILIICFLGGIIFIGVKTVSLSEKQEALDRQTKIQNEVKITVRPFLFSKENIISFMIELESYEHADLAHINVLESSFLLDDEENPTLPFLWEEKEKGKYNQKGVLFFKGIKETTAFISLNIYELDEQIFTWTLRKEE